jgi:hypothetical protein
MGKARGVRRSRTLAQVGVALALEQLQQASVVVQVHARLQAAAADDRQSHRLLPRMSHSARKE